MEKDSFVFYREWKDAISGLPDEVRLEIYEAIIEYGTSGKLSDLKPMAMLAFSFAKTKIDRDTEKYSATCAKRAEAAKLSHAAKAAKAANAANAADNDSDMISSNEDKKKPPKGGKKDAAAAAAPIEKRKGEFYNSLVPFVERYGKDMVREFFDYWSETNKSRTRMRYELERTWDAARRLATWASRENKFTERYGTDRKCNSTAGQREADAASIVARILAEDDGDVRK